MSPPSPRLRLSDYVFSFSNAHVSFARSSTLLTGADGVFTFCLELAARLLLARLLLHGCSIAHKANCETFFFCLEVKKNSWSLYWPKGLQFFIAHEPNKCPCFICKILNTADRSRGGIYILFGVAMGHSCHVFATWLLDCSQSKL